MAPEVARTKWNTKAPIDDPLRDKQIIDGVATAATEYGLDPQVASTFFIAQIEASKAVQNALHAEWTAKRQPPFAKVADLGKDIRPVLDRLTPAMTGALLEALPGTAATRGTPTAGSAGQGGPLQRLRGRHCGTKRGCTAARVEQMSDGGLNCLSLVLIYRNPMDRTSGSEGTGCLAWVDSHVHLRNPDGGHIQFRRSRAAPRGC